MLMQLVQDLMDAINNLNRYEKQKNTKEIELQNQIEALMYQNQKLNEEISKLSWEIRELKTL